MSIRWTARARAQGGVTWGELNRETQLHGLAVTGGTISTTGIAGLTLGGGLGWLMGKHGIAADNLVSAEVVTASGAVVTASESEHPDLFWALRGGGGNFGVVSSFEYRLHPVGPIITGGLAIFPFSDAAGVLRFFRDFTAAAPDDLGVMGVCSTRPTAPARSCPHCSFATPAARIKHRRILPSCSHSARPWTCRSVTCPTAR